MVRRVLIIAGEASGDLHGSGVVRELKRKVPGIEVYGVGGDRMVKEGMEAVVHISELSFMGFAEVVRNLRTVFRVERTLLALLRTRRPDVVVLIDYPGMNLRFAKTAKRQGLPVLYYISPQVWAWNKGRIRTMRGRVDTMKVVFPFEVDLYRRAGIDAEFVGHPIVEHIGSSMSREAFFALHGFAPSKKLIGVFPGSRPQEIERILPLAAAAASRLADEANAQVGISVAPNLRSDILREHLRDHHRCVLVENGTYDLMNHADVAIVTSGTATLETGWFGTPMVVVYRTSPLTFLIGRMLVNVPAIGLVNIVAGKKIVPELIQHQMTVEAVAAAAGRFLRDEAYARSVRRELSILRERLGGPGASSRVADSVISLGAAA